jgi:hypothetical protein
MTESVTKWGSSLDPLAIYTGCLVGGAGLLASGLVASGAELGSTWAVLALGLIAVAAERQPVRISPNAEITVSVLPILFAAVQY